MKPVFKYRNLYQIGVKIFCMCLLFCAHLASAEIIVTTTDVTGCKEEDGKAVITVSPGGDYDFEYSVDGGPFQTSNSFEKLAKGNHLATVRDKKTKCQYSKPFEIKGFNKLTVSVTGFGERQFCQGTTPPTVTLTASASGGSGDYEFSWPGATLTVSSSGSFSVTVTDKKTGCTESAGGEVLIVPIVCSRDPNDIIGPEGFGPKKMISKFKAHPYIIRFENDPEFATASAQVVRINHPLDTNVNPLSLRLGDFGFANMVFNVPQNRISYSTRLNLVDTLGIVVDVTAGIDVTKREAFWIFESKDPETGLPPTDATLGFLPINDSTSKGEGFVSYQINPTSSTVTGDSIFARANIVFDINEPIVTPTIFNTVDAEPPASHIKTATLTAVPTMAKITWAGQDDPNGSGIREFAFFVSENNGPFLAYESGITDTAIVFVGSPGKKYRFFTLATDNTENQEPNKSQPEATLEFQADSTNAPAFILNGEPTTSLALSICKSESVDTCIQVIDIDGDSILFTLAKSPSHGSAKLIKSNSGICLTFVADSTFNGEDYWSISACDKGGLCDTLLVQVNIKPQVETNVSVLGRVLLATAKSAQYQWLRCEGVTDHPYTVQTGMKSQSFSPSESGSYAVVVRQKGCLDTSSCYAVIVTGTEAYAPLENLISLFPNPTTSKIKLTTVYPLSDLSVELIGNAGIVLLKSYHATLSSLEIDLNKFPLGVYHLNVISRDKSAVFKLIKQ